MRQLLTEAIKSLIAFAVRSETSVDDSATRSLMILYVSEQPMLLNVPDNFGKDDVTSVRQGAVLHKKTAAGDGDDHGVKEKGAFQRTKPL